MLGQLAQRVGTVWFSGEIQDPPECFPALEGFTGELQGLLPSPMDLCGAEEVCEGQGWSI